MDIRAFLILDEPISIAWSSGLLSAMGIFLLWPKVVSKRSAKIDRFHSKNGYGLIDTPHSEKYPKSKLLKGETDQSALKIMEFRFFQMRPNIRLRYAYSTFVASLVSVMVLFWTRSIYVTSPFTIFAAVISWVYLRNRDESQSSAISQVWPDVIDHLISGLHSGLSLAEAMSSLAIRGPRLVRPHFQMFDTKLKETGNFVEACENLRESFRSHGSDQILEAVLIAKTLGGSELLEIFRVLGNFLRQDLSLRREIEIKRGWIKNSAHLSSSAPWILLLLLSSQPGTVKAFSMPSGLLVLAAGLAMTFLAYFWMGKLGRLPDAPRVFGRGKNA